jgi:hypothetical protein
MTRMTYQAWMTPVVTIAAVVLLAGDVAEADQLSCQDRIVALGDPTSEVSWLCGPPDSVNTRVERRAVRRPVVVPCAIGRCVAYVDDSIEVTVDEWVYDFGPRRFVQFLLFEQGRLVNIHAGGYGHKPI